MITVSLRTSNSFEDESKIFEFSTQQAGDETQTDTEKEDDE